MKKVNLILAGIYFVLAALAVLSPRIAAKGEQAMAASALAALVFLVLGGLASLLALVLLIRVLIHFKQLDAVSRLVGVLPALVTATGLVLLFVFVIQ